MFVTVILRTYVGANKGEQNIDYFFAMTIFYNHF